MQRVFHLWCYRRTTGSISRDLKFSSLVSRRRYLKECSMKKRVSGMSVCLKEVEKTLMVWGWSSKLRTLYVLRLKTFLNITKVVFQENFFFFVG